MIILEVHLERVMSSYKMLLYLNNTRTGISKPLKIFSFPAVSTSKTGAGIFLGVSKDPLKYPEKPKRKPKTLIRNPINIFLEIQRGAVSPLARLRGWPSADLLNSLIFAIKSACSTIAKSESLKLSLSKSLVIWSFGCLVFFYFFIWSSGFLFILFA